MVQGKCHIRDCEFVVRNGQHVDDVVEKLRQHHRALHPTKAFWDQRQQENVEQYNSTLEDIYIQTWGRNEGRVDAAQRIQLCEQLIQSRERRGPVYCEATYAEVEALLANPPVVAPGNVPAPPDNGLIDVVFEDDVAPQAADRPW